MLDDSAGVVNHKIFVAALNAFSVKTIYGKFQHKKIKFSKAHNKIFTATYGKKTYNQEAQFITLPLPDRLKFGKYEEKRSDVNMATQIIVD
jgi:hypothetical protein